MAVWNRDGSQNPKAAQISSNRMSSISWSPNGKEIALGGYVPALRLLNVDDLSIRTPFDPIPYIGFSSLAWNPEHEGLLAAVGGNQVGTYLFKWRRDAGKLDEPKQLIKDAAVYGTDWSGDGETLATTSNNAIQLWDRDGEPIGRPIWTDDVVGKVAWSPDGRMLAVASGNSVKLFRKDGSLVTILKGHTGKVTNLTWTQGTLVSTSNDHTVKLWQTEPIVADDLLGALQEKSCKWLNGYLQNNKWMNPNDAGVRDLCGF